MSIMPVNGWTDLSQAPESDLLQMKLQGICPKCHSSEWKSAGMVYQEGTSVSRSRTRGKTIGIARAGFRNGTTIVGGGVYSGHTIGVSQTLLSERATPPQMRTGLITFLTVIGVILACIALSQISNGHISVFLYDGSLTGILAIAALWIYEKRRRVHDHAMSVYSDTRLCLRCGNFYTGSGGTTLRADTPADSQNIRLALLAIFILTFAISAFTASRQNGRGNNERAEQAEIIEMPIQSQVIRASGSESAVEKDSIDGTGSAPPIMEQAESSTPKEANEFKWSTVGLPVYMTYALTTPNIVPASGHQSELNLGPTDRTQTIFRDGEDHGADTRAGGSLWYITEPSDADALLKGRGALYQTVPSNNGYRNLLVADNDSLIVFEYHDGKYAMARCFARGDDADSPPREITCSQ
jgi:hypothetical protein